MSQRSWSAVLTVLEQVLPQACFAVLDPGGGLRVCSPHLLHPPLPDGSTQGQRLKLEDADGTLRGWLWTDAPPERLAALEPTRRLCAALLEQEAQVQAAQTEHHLLRQMLERAPLMVYAKDEGGRIVLANPALASAYGMEVPGFLARGAQDPLFYIPPEQRPDILDNDALVRASGETLTLEEHIRTPDGVPRWFVSTKTPFVAPDGSTHILGLSSEITAQKQLEERLSLFERAVEASSSAISIAEVGGRILYINPAGQRLSGYTLEDFAGTGQPLPMPAEMLERLRQHALQGLPLQQEMLLHTKDGREIPVLQRMDPLPHPGGGPLLVVASATDLSQERELERLRDDFVALASHELRTPLTAIQGALRLICEGVLGEVPPPVQEMVEIAASSAERLGRLVHDLLDLSRLEQAALGSEPERLELYPLLERVVLEYRSYAQDLGLGLRLEGEELALEVSAVADRLIQVVTNLLSNAIKFTPAGQTLEVALLERGGQARIEVRDRGPGIPLELRPRLFERFARASSARHVGGTGLGLAISRSIVQQSGGEIGFVDRPGGGTVFYVELPLLKLELAS